MKKFKLFIENFLVYGLGGIISKAVPLIMVPIVTRLMPSSEYFGISDLSNTVVSFASAFAVMGMYDAMYRMFFDYEDEERKKNVCSAALIFTICTSFIVFLLMIFSRKWIAAFFFNNTRYGYVVYISAIATLVGATNSIVSAPTRMQNQRKIYIVTNFLSSVISYLVAIPLLLKGYYIIALPLSTVIAGVSMEVSFIILNHKWFSVRRFDIDLLKKLLVLAIPLLPNFLTYWLFNSCDKIMITNMIGLDAAGIYSVGSKLGQVSQLIYTAFAGGWQYFAFSTMKEKNQVKSNSLIFEYLGVISFVVTAFISAFSFFIFKMLFTQQYLEGFVVAPYLFLAPLMQMLFQVAANQFLVVKKTWPMMMILLSGALVNIFLNFVGIPLLGIEGAAIATLIGYIVSDIICVIVLTRMKLMKISIKFVVASFAMAVYLVFWHFLFCRNTIMGLFFTIGFTALICLLYRSDLKKFIG